MAPRTRTSARRAEALSRGQIVAAAVALLDAGGEDGLTFRALTGRLATGPGAVYRHVAGKDELLDAATDAVVAAALAPSPHPGAAGPPGAQDRIRAVALGLFDAIDDHPWLAAQLSAQLSRSPWGSVTPRIVEGVGRPVRALGVPESGWFTATFALVHYVLGAAGQNAANARSAGPHADRDGFLAAVAAAWGALDPDDYPVTRAVADRLRDHDDRAEFLAGVDLVLAGIVAVHPPRPRV